MEELVTHKNIIKRAKAHEGPGWAVIAEVGRGLKTPCVISVHPEPRAELSEGYHAALLKAAKDYSARPTYPHCTVVYVDSLADFVSKAAKTNLSDIKSLSGGPMKIDKYSVFNFKNMTKSWHADFLNAIFPPIETKNTTYGGGPKRKIGIENMTKPEQLNEFLDYVSLMGRASEIFNSKPSEEHSTQSIDMAKKIGLDVHELILRAFHNHFREKPMPMVEIGKGDGIDNLKRVIRKYENSDDKELSGMASDLRKAAEANNIRMTKE